jgi:3-hydroxyacyl-CoA dehydrogenase/enoyl-CoA hydratase/3-hydroxybutyryl-CoA epimerase
MIHYRKDTDNIVTLTFDMEARSHNFLNHEIADALFPVLEHLLKEKQKRKLRGVILTSAKKTFMAGGDLEYLFQDRSAEEYFAYSNRLRKLFRAFESPGVPVVAAINGRSVGTGFELAMACHHRILLDERKIRVGFPEVKYGLMPGNGGAIRLMWLLGIERALPILTNGRTYRPKEALKAGIVDDLAKDKKDLLQKAKDYILKLEEGRRRWDVEGEKIPGGTANAPKNLGIIATMIAEMSQKYKGHYPAPMAILNTLIEGSKVDFDTASRIESRYYTKLLQSKVAKNMMTAFWKNYTEMQEGASRPKGFGRFRPRKVGIVGAGRMGSGIALACLRNGQEVVLKDISKLVADRGRDYVKKRLDELIKLHRVTPEYQKELLGKITTTETSKDFEDCDLVIEAVFENINVKRKVNKEAEAHMDEYTLFATNTISIPITKLAESSSRPENYVGLHFFPPAESVPLVEIIRGKKTSDETLARAYDFIHAIKKTPIIVKDGWGFYAMRVQNTYILEGITMLLEGISPAIIDNLGVQAGMRHGPLALADDISIKIVQEYENQAAEHYGKKYVQHPAVAALEKMTSLERFGKYKKAGFYEYPEKETKHFWTELTEHFPNTKTEISRQKKIDRLMFSQVLEAVWCLQEKVIKTVAEANLGSIYGWRFPKFKGGVIQFINDYGKAEFIERCGELEAEFGQRFQVPKLLIGDEIV